MTEERLSRLEEGLAIANANTMMLARAFRQTAAREAQAEAARLDALTAPRSLAEPRTGIAADPDLGSPLLARLAGDPAMGGSIAGSSLAALQSVNLLDDPTFDWCHGISVTTSWAPLGPYWEARYTLDSGTSPAAVVIDVVQLRQFHSSALLAIAASWTGIDTAGTITVQVRTRVVQPGSYLDWPYTTGAWRLFGDNQGSGDPVVLCTAKAQLLDAAWGSVLAESDPVDMNAIRDVQLEARPFAVFEQDPATPASVNLQLEATFDYPGVVGVANKGFWLIAAEPQVNHTDEESPPVFEPRFGRYTIVPQLVGVGVVRTTNQTLTPSTWTPIRWNSTNHREDYDSHGFHDPSVDSGEQLVAPVSGVYFADASIGFDSNSTGDRQAKLVLHYAGGGTKDVALHKKAASGSGRTDVPVSREFYMDVGDWVELEGWHDRGSNLDVLGDSSIDYTYLTLSLRGWNTSLWVAL